MAGLGIGQAGKLFSIAKNKLDLEAGFAHIEERHRIRIEIGGKQQGTARLVALAPIEQDDDA